jgi:predicted ATPase
MLLEEKMNQYNKLKTRVAIIGRSGSGKSTLIRLLKDNPVGMPVLDEVARTVLKEHEYQSSVFKQVQMLYKQFHNEAVAGSFISDRGLHDYVVFSERIGMNPPFYREQLPGRYNFVFKLPNRPFQRDHVRVESGEEEAEALQREIDNLYRQTDHELIQVPDVSPEKKYKFIMEFLKHRHVGRN